MNIHFDQVTKTFAGTPAIQNIDLTIQDGELLSLLGPSGCGKSTTLMMLAGLYQPTRGSIRFGNQVVNELPPKARNIGMVFQSYALYPHLTVRENIAFPLKQQKVRKKERNQRVEQAAALVKMDDYLDRRPAQLSGGQQQRTALARAIVKQPDVLLLDEPMSNLDARLKMETREEIRRIQKELNITTVIVTHDQEEAMAIGDRVAVLDDGLVQQCAEPNELYNHPNHLFVAHFLGNPPMNLLTGHLKIWDNETWLISENREINIPDDQVPVDTHFSGSDVQLGFRPHQAVIKEKQNPYTFAATVKLVEQLGREKLVQAIIGSSLVRVLVANDAAVGIEDVIHIQPSYLHIFDQHTGEALTQKRSQVIYGTSLAADHA